MKKIIIWISELLKLFLSILTDLITCVSVFVLHIFNFGQRGWTNFIVDSCKVLRCFGTLYVTENSIELFY